MSLQGTLNLGHGVAETLCFGQKQFLTPIQIDITIKMNWRRLWQTKKFTEQEMLTLRNSKYRVSTFMIQHQFFHALERRDARALFRCVQHELLVHKIPAMQRAADIHHHDAPGFRPVDFSEVHTERKHVPRGGTAAVRMPHIAQRGSGAAAALKDKPVAIKSAVAASVRLVRRV